MAIESNGGERYIGQDGQTLNTIANAIRDCAADFERVYEDYYTKLKENLGDPGDARKIWFGRRAQLTRIEAEQKKDIYVQGYQAIMALADQLDHNVATYATHEYSKG